MNKKTQVKIVMKIRLIILANLMFVSCITYGDQKFDLDTPEGWAMAFMTTSAQNLGQMPPRSVNIRGPIDFGGVKLYTPPHQRAAGSWDWRCQE